MSGEAHHTNYVKIWLILLALLGVSIAGPTLEIQAVTIITAFGVAIVKAYLVAKHFMHLNVQPRYVTYMVCSCLALMLVFWAGTAPDVYNQEGANWVKINQAPQPESEPHGVDH
jgi:caa(3)-type oxidase subunit IV